MIFLSEQFVLKLCQIDNLCQSWGKLEIFVNEDKHSVEDKSYEFLEGHETFSDHSFGTKNNFSETLSE